MLRYLRIRNLALFAEVEIPFGPGLNLLTGETGAGKSILVDALGLVLGARASTDLIRGGARRAVVEAVFRTTAEEGVRSLLDEAGIDPDPEDAEAPAGETDLIVRRELGREGGRAFLNGCPATVATLRRVGERLFELHGQHRHLSLLRPGSQRDLLDAFADAGDLRAETAAAHRELAGARRRLQELRAGREDRQDRIEMLRLRLREIEAVDPRPGEEEELRRERGLLSHGARIAELLGEARSILEEDGEGSLLARSARLGAVLGELEGYAPEFGAAREEIDTARIALDELAAWLRGRAPSISQDPGRLEEVEGRLAALAALQRRFAGQLSDIVAAADRMRAELGEREADAADPEAAAREVEAAAGRFAAVAARLSERRRRGARKLEAAVQEELAQLAMEGTRLDVSVERQEAVEGPVRLRGVPLRYDAHGIDRVEIRFSPNPGEEPRPVARAASGGELSRLMLALEGAARARRADAPRRLVFDEVDAGIGGRVASAVGDKLHGLARDRQVICVTHLPQIASRADHHYRVEKGGSGGRTVARVRPLDRPGRVAEVARMLGGTRITPATRRHAQEMIGART